MEGTKTLLTVETLVNSPVEKAWKAFTDPDHITQWNFASPDWQCPWAKNDLRPGGSFSSRMEAKDGSMGFEFGGVYDAVEPGRSYSYTLGDGRKVSVTFESTQEGAKINQVFEAESTHPAEMQRSGWQSIMDSFKNHVEQLPADD